MMKRNIITFILSLLCVGAFAQIAPLGIANDPIDYSRLDLPTDEPSYVARFTMNIDGAVHNDALKYMADVALLNLEEISSTHQVHCSGQLIHAFDISPEYVERCIQDAFRTAKINGRDELAKMLKDTPKFKDFTYTKEKFLDEMFSMATSVIPTNGVGTIVATGTGLVLSARAGSFDGVAGASTAIGIEQGLIEAVGGESNVLGAAGQALTAYSMYNMLSDAYDRDMQKYDNWVNMLNMARIDYFYHLVNMYLRINAKGMDKVWIVSIPEKHETLPVTFRGEPCEVTWTIKAGAIRLQNPVIISSTDGADFDGEYFGHFDAVASFNLSNYDTKYIAKSKDPSDPSGLSEHVEKKQYAGLMVANDEVRSKLNMYLAMAEENSNLAVSNIHNSATGLYIHYMSPIHISIEKPDFKGSTHLEAAPEYFWDFYDSKLMEGHIDKSAVMNAMGLTLRGKDSDVDFRLTLDKRYTFSDLLNQNVEKVREYVNGGNLILDQNGYTSSTPVKEADLGSDIPSNIPRGTLFISWATEVKPPQRSPRDLTKEKWKEVFDKYSMPFNL